jgi:hypothetical protein
MCDGVLVSWGIHGSGVVWNSQLSIFLVVASSKSDRLGEQQLRSWPQNCCHLEERARSVTPDIRTSPSKTVPPNNIFEDA